MAIAFDATSNSGYNTADAVYSWSHTTAGTSRLLVIAVSMLSVAGSSVTGITYNGVALTKIRSDVSGTGTIRTELWRLTNPDLGANTIEVTLSAALDSVAGAFSLTGVNQTNPIGDHDGASATNVGADDATVTLITTIKNSWVLDTIASSDTALTENDGTIRWNISGALGSGAGRTQTKATPGTINCVWTDIGALATWTVSAVEIAEEQKAAVIYFPYKSTPNMTKTIADTDGRIFRSLRK